MASGGSRNGAGRKRSWNRDTIKENIPVVIAYNIKRLIKDLDEEGIEDDEKIRLWESVKAQKIKKYNSPISAGAHMTSSIRGDELGDDYEEINILELLIPSPGKMDLLTVTGNSMIDIGIFPGDLLIVERTELAKDGDIVIVSLDDEVMVKRLCIRKNQALLISENKDHQPIDLIDREYRIIGVVENSIRRNLKSKSQWDSKL
jgi:DNA polymerase V